MSLAKEIKKARPFESLEQEAMLNLLRTADVLAGQMMVRVFKAHGISAAQYNVLRILRGAGESLACGEIGSRMITRDPDITRLLDRLEKRGLISRGREEKDRRVVCTRITEAGLKLLAEIDPSVQQAHRRQLGHMGPQKLKQLIALLEEARERSEG
ncbi:MAG TPA: MarR family transcriptional regulator [Tepidisphaeraceae bacterium]|nr:MarR family transcriptional regulator [Tepidisphaeraceae bacterium]